VKAAGFGLLAVGASWLTAGTKWYADCRESIGLFKLFVCWVFDCAVISNFYIRDLL